MLGPARRRGFSSHNATCVSYENVLGVSCRHASVAAPKVAGRLKPSGSQQSVRLQAIPFRQSRSDRQPGPGR